MTPQELLERGPTPPITIKNAYTDWQPMEFKNTRAYEKFKQQKDAEKLNPKPVAEPRKSMKAQTSLFQKPKASTPEPKPVSRPQQSNITKGIGKHGEISHDYTDFPPHPPREEDEDDAWASSKVADKTHKMMKGTGLDNAILMNEFGEKIIVRSFFSFPMIHSPQHQIFDKKSPIDSALYQAFKTNVPEKNFKSTTIKRGNIGYESVDITHKAVEAASLAIHQTFQGEDLATHHGRYPILWINPQDRNNRGTKTFALSHWVRIPPNTTIETADTMEHIIFGYYDSAGVEGSADTLASNPKKLFSNFSVGEIEKVMNFYGIGANALKRISALKPSRVLGLNGDYDGKDDIDGLNYTVEGRVLNDPWPDLRRSIDAAFGDNPPKHDKLVEVTGKIIGKSASDPARYPIKLENISYKDNGFSTNALTVDYMEILHPLIAMKPNGVINNGIYNAARTYLGQQGEGGKIEFNLQDCAVGYPDAANAKLFDSVLINKKTKSRLLISSKDNEGAKPSVGSLGAVYDLFEQHLDLFSAANETDPELGEFISRTMNGAPTEFKEMMRFFITQNRGTTPEMLKQYMPSTSGGRALAQLVINGDPNVAAKLNTWNGGNSFSSSGRGKFIEFCSSVMRFTPLVQINTLNDKPGKIEVDKADTIVISGFLATWPNKIFDEISFEQAGTALRFKIGVGSGSGEVKVRKPNDKQGNRVYQTEPRFDKFKSRDYSGQMKDQPRFTYTSKINKMVVPGFGKTWNVLNNALSNIFTSLLKEAKGNQQLFEDKLFSNRDVRSLYNYAIAFSKQNGYDPGMSNNSDYTVREMLNIIGKALGK